MRAPFYWKKRKGYYLWVTGEDGKKSRVRVGDTKKEADKKWKLLIASAELEEKADHTFAKVAKAWLTRQKQRLDRGLVTEEWFKRVTRTVTAFRKANPGVACSVITPVIAVAWLPAGTSQEYERTEVGTLKQILNWAEGTFISKSPLKTMKLERGKRREVLVSAEQHKQLMEACPHQCFRDLMEFAWNTGCRPGELRRLLWEHVSDDLKSASMMQHKNSKKSKAPRVLYFNAALQAWLGANRKDEGFVFLNTRGRPWTKDAVVQRMDSLEEATGIRVTAYAYRHSFITRAILQGVDPATVAELTGTSIEMISRHYCHADKAKAHLAAANEKLTDASA